MTKESKLEKMRKRCEELKAEIERVSKDETFIRIEREWSQKCTDADKVINTLTNKKREFSLQIQRDLGFYVQKKVEREGGEPYTVIVPNPDLIEALKQKVKFDPKVFNPEHEARWAEDNFLDAVRRMAELALQGNSRLVRMEAQIQRAWVKQQRVHHKWMRAREPLDTVVQEMSNLQNEISRQEYREESKKRRRWNVRSPHLDNLRKSLDSIVMGVVPFKWKKK